MDTQRILETLELIEFRVEEVTIESTGRNSLKEEAILFVARNALYGEEDWNWKDEEEINHE